jgi:hypothetical protein
MWLDLMTCDFTDHFSFVFREHRRYMTHSVSIN